MLNQKPIEDSRHRIELPAGQPLINRQKLRNRLEAHELQTA